MSQTRLITLLTDFADRDVYVGVMKGAIAQINPNIPVVDLTHQIPPQNIAAARFCLMSAFPYFPDGTVHLAVVDPEVGSSRRAVAVELENGFLVSPDNGILSGVLTQAIAVAAVELNNSQYWRTSKPSLTFHGRDIFAPVAAHLANGVPLRELGSEISVDSLVELELPKCRPGMNGVVGCIQYIDVFGNLITNIPGSYIPEKPWHVNIAGFPVSGAETYSSVNPGEAIAIVDSDGWVEIAINQGNARSRFNSELGQIVELFF
ncbi:SAM-dependent chlorinase/fluorinase [Calothrix sp. UHCC 0171]|uniref:SAM hydrolase/SAM-dependent halogenase family protein n=1 Tax=Calothrix sp. UHCC 0171 TaxID=3110245 RepID=UPI002B212382|nr:SAM-dependent chlorinase/fluorinase [Calothrix sp. UHCC 0171]MEA5574270.1 SAM-dependent chlorinase/fluorinase [Calothrix sp. UHCC 0171]